MKELPCHEGSSRGGQRDKIGQVGEKAVMMLGAVLLMSGCEVPSQADVARWCDEMKMTSRSA